MPACRMPRGNRAETKSCLFPKFVVQTVKFELVTTPWKINGWNLQITHSESRKGSEPNLHEDMFHANLQGSILLNLSEFVGDLSMIRRVILRDRCDTHKKITESISKQLSQTRASIETSMLIVQKSREPPRIYEILPKKDSEWYKCEINDHGFTMSYLLTG